MCQSFHDIMHEAVIKANARVQREYEKKLEEDRKRQETEDSFYSKFKKIIM